MQDLDKTQEILRNCRECGNSFFLLTNEMLLCSLYRLD